MAAVYNKNGEYITQGLQGSSVCDEALIAAREIAASHNEDVVLHDDDGYWLVSPDGEVTAVTAKEIGFE